MAGNSVIRRSLQVSDQAQPDDHHDDDHLPQSHGHCRIDVRQVSFTKLCKLRPKHYCSVPDVFPLTADTSLYSGLLHILNQGADGVDAMA
jgi:hypothetical protein